MTFRKVFAFNGRIGRRAFWFTLVAPLVAWIAFCEFDELHRALPSVYEGVVIPLWICVVWVTIAAYVKRLHDRGKSGWWMLIAFVPVIGQMWLFVEAGFLRGTTGSNKYGSDLTAARG
jgi:uncharacterized membrane protein YhaH (DUF805 family)